MRVFQFSLLFLIVACSSNKGDFVPDDSWTAKDSVDCWVIQLTNHYALETEACFAAENSFGKVYIKCNNSLFEFDYPCQYIGAYELEQYQGKIRLSGEERGDWSSDGFALFLSQENAENKELVEEVYFPIRMETEEFVHLMDIDKHPRCEKDSINQYYTDFEHKKFKLRQARAQMYFNHLNM